MDHEIISTAILLPSADSRRVVESMCTKYWLTASSSLTRKKMGTDRPNMTIDVDLGDKATKHQAKVLVNRFVKLALEKSVVR